MKLNSLKSQEDWKYKLVKLKSIYLKLIPLIPIFVALAFYLNDGSVGG